MDELYPYLCHNGTTETMQTFLTRTGRQLTFMQLSDALYESANSNNRDLFNFFYGKLQDENPNDNTPTLVFNILNNINMTEFS